MPSGLPTSFGTLFDGSLLAAGGIAPGVFAGSGGITNSLVVAVIVTVGLLLFSRMATSKMALVPGKKQNFVEMVVEFLYGQVEGIVGKHLAPKAFPLLATLFIFILASNWFGLIPGVGTIGFGPTTTFGVIDESALADHGNPDDGAAVHAGEGGSHEKAEHEGEAADDDHGDHADHAEHQEFVPLLRPPTADLNMTLAMALVFMFVWTWITVREVGVWGFLVHTFGPKGGLQGALKVILIPVFMFVGVIEIISIIFRPISLSFRLLGNVYAGESLLHAMNHIGGTLGMGSVTSFFVGLIVPIPFYFMEILVGLIQAIVFTLLCAVYVQLSASHDEEAH
jgi:F-type H+-transporting ATPase subunit a